VTANDAPHLAACLAVRLLQYKIEYHAQLPHPQKIKEKLFPFHPVHHSKMRLPDPFITLQLPLLHLTTITALAIGPSHQVLRLGLTLPLFVLLVSQSLYREWGGTWGHHYAIECMVMTCVWVYFDWNILGSPDREGWRKVHNDEDGEKKKAGNGKVPEGFWARFWWGVRLGMGSRYVGWSCEVKNVPREGGSRW
jgi:hypothetical protein